MASTVQASHRQRGEAGVPQIDKVNEDLLTFTYGSLVVQLLEDLGSVDAVNSQLERMGYSIGVRIIEEFLARSGAGNRRCRTLKEAAEAVATQAFPMFLGEHAFVENEVSENSANKGEISICFGETPLTHYVELPEENRGLHFANILCGVIRGALEMIQMRVECRFEQDMLLGADKNEIRITLKEILEDEAPPDDE